MKKCPYCAEEIQDDAIKCRYCGEYLNGSQHTTDVMPIRQQLTEENRDRLNTLPNKYYSISQNQKRILIAVIAVLVAMIAYPPYVVYNKGAIFNMGYGWIFDPPKRGYVTATINVSLLIIQWIGVLLVGGIAFFLTKGASVPLGSSPRQSSSRTEAVQPAGGGNESGKFLGGIHHPWRRLFARTVDVSTLGLLALFVVAFAVGILLPDNYEGFAKTLENQIIAGFIGLALWIPVEAVLLSTVGNTPGKWLFGILVRTTSGHKPSFSQALERSFRVVLQGLGLGIPPVPLFTQLFAYRRLTKTGTTLWDTATECVVTHKTWGAARAAVCVAAVLLVFVFGSLLNLTGKKDDSDPGGGKNPFSEKDVKPAPAPAPAPKDIFDTLQYGPATAPAPAPAPAPEPAPTPSPAKAPLKMEYVGPLTKYDKVPRPSSSAQSYKKPKSTPVPAPVPISSEQEHFDRIRRVHPDFEKYRDNGAIKAWIQKQPLNLRASLQKTYDEGDTDSVIALLRQFKKDNKIPAGETPIK